MLFVERARNVYFRPYFTASQTMGGEFCLNSETPDVLSETEQTLSECVWEQSFVLYMNLLLLIEVFTICNGLNISISIT